MAENFRTEFAYHVPETVPEALCLLSRYGSACRVIAGGTDLIPKVKAGVLRFDHLISLKRLDSMKTVTYDPERGLTIGGCTSLRAVEDFPQVRGLYPALYTGVHSIANTQIRNRGTVVGNLCNAVPRADAAPALLVYGTQVAIQSERGQRVVPLEAFFTGVCRTVLEPDEMVTHLILPPPEPGAYSVYFKYAIRKALDLAMVGVAACVSAQGRTVTSAKLALGAVAVTPKRASNTEALITGRELTEDLILQAAKTASEEDCAPISDIRATAGYRREMVRVHVRDALRKAVEGK